MKTKGQTDTTKTFEKLGAFFLGRRFDDAKGAITPDLVLYDAKDLTTHAVCVGMTGSGKTGLCVSLLEEAAIDGIPAIVIDPKGDMGNLMLNFPELGAADFRPWVDSGEAARKGKTPDEFASAAHIPCAKMPRAEALGRYRRGRRGVSSRCAGSRA